MSSSRSVQASRQRRSAEPAQRPYTSIASQSVFNNQGQNRAPPRPNQGYPPQHYSQQQAPQQPQPKPKISVSDAIALTTIRLGRVEQFIQQIQDDGLLVDGGSSSIPDNMKIIDEGVLKSLINRLDSLEKRETENVLSVNNSANTTALADKISSLEKELRDVKDLLFMMTVKHEKTTDDNGKKIAVLTDKITNIDNSLDVMQNKQTDMFNALQELENSKYIYEEDNNMETTDIDNTELNVDEINVNLSPTLDAETLKNLISNEFR